MIPIYISTYKRLEKQKTFNNLPKIVRKNTFFVVYKEEKDFFIKKYGKKRVLVVPDGIRGLSQKRQWILENAKEKFIVMADDDLIFLKRINGKLVRTKKGVKNILEKWEKWFEENKDLAIIGLSCRAGNNWVKEEFKENTAITCFYAINREIFLKENIRFDRVPLMQDKDIALQALTKGYRTRTHYWYAQSQTFGTKGGCSTYRNDDLMKKSIELLKKYHGNLVESFTKIKKSCWNGAGIKTEKGTKVTLLKVNWKKAYKGKNSILDFL